MKLKLKEAFIDDISHQEHIRNSNDSLKASFVSSALYGVVGMFLVSFVRETGYSPNVVFMYSIVIYLILFLVAFISYRMISFRKKKEMMKYLDYFSIDLTDEGILLPKNYDKELLFVNYEDIKGIYEVGRSYYWIELNDDTHFLVPNIFENMQFLMMYKKRSGDRFVVFDQINRQLFVTESKDSLVFSEDELIVKDFDYIIKPDLYAKGLTFVSNAKKLPPKDIGAFIINRNNFK